MKCSVEACARRDPKSLYKKASAGQIKDLTGPQDLYEEPLKPDLIVDFFLKREKVGHQKRLSRYLFRPVQQTGHSSIYSLSESIPSSSSHCMV